MITEKYYITELLIRILTACIFIFQGYDKLFQLGIPSIHKYFSEDFEKINFHPIIGKVLIILSTWIEFLGGMILLVGFYRIYILMVLLAQIVIISVFFSTLRPLWDMKHVWPRLVLLVFLIIIPADWARYSVDYLIHK